MGIHRHHSPPTSSPLSSAASADGLQEGDPIPGSKYYRHFCPKCGEAMRVSGDVIGKPLWCETCRGRTPAGQIVRCVGNPHPATPAAERDYNGGSLVGRDGFGGLE